MPTGYTADVGKGRVTDLKQFASQCARGLMPFVHMRDEPWDAPLRMPESPEFEINLLEEAKNSLKNWLSSNEEDRYAQWSDWFSATEKRNNDILTNKAETEARYRKMLSQVMAVDADDNVRPFKSFMIEQLNESIRRDCRPYRPDPPYGYVKWCEVQDRHLKSSFEYRVKLAEQAKARYEKQCILIKAYAEAFNLEVEGL